MFQKAQLSLEYLLLLAVSLSIFAMLLPLLNTVYSAALFGLDSANAKAFSQELKESIGELSFQGNGAAIVFEATALAKWKLVSEGNELHIFVVGPEGREKEFVVFFPNKPGLFSKTIEGKASFLLRKESGKILLEHNNG